VSIVYAIVDRLQTTDQLYPYTYPVDFSEIIDEGDTQSHRYGLYEVTLPSWMSPTAFFAEWTLQYWDFLVFGCSPDWDEDVWTGLRVLYAKDISMFLAALYLLRTRVRDPARKDAKRWLTEWLSARSTVVPQDWLAPLNFYDNRALTYNEELRLRRVFSDPPQYIVLDAMSANVNCESIMGAMEAAMCLADLDGDHETDDADLDVLAGMA
jgi:hypothetical protein